jgi:ribosomal protein S18 acetylase RimI-like enzyme
MWNEGPPFHFLDILDWEDIMILKIQKLKKRDISEVKKLCEAAHWPYTLRDIERLYRLEPSGWFCAIVNGHYAGQAMGLQIESLGCIGIVIVHPGLRRQGIATALTKAALDYLTRKGIKTVKLDATPEGYGIYEKLNFTLEFSVLHCVRDASIEPVSEEKPEGIELLNLSGYDALSQFDKKYYGVNRSQVLMALKNDSEGFVLKERKKIRGYAMVKPMDYDNGYWLGPLVAENLPSAENLLKHVLKTFRGKEIRLGAIEANSMAKELLSKYGFRVDFKISRMRFGPKLRREDPTGIFAEAGHEKG